MKAPRLQIANLAVKRHNEIRREEAQRDAVHGFRCAQALHLGAGGAPGRNGCAGEEDPAQYNKRLEAAFEERRIKAWPFSGSVIVEERSESGVGRESFFIDNWCLLASSRIQEDERIDNVYDAHRFDYDSYKILYSYLSDPLHATGIRTLTRHSDSLRLFLEGKARD